MANLTCAHCSVAIHPVTSMYCQNCGAPSSTAISRPTRQKRALQQEDVMENPEPAPMRAPPVREGYTKEDAINAYESMMNNDPELAACVSGWLSAKRDATFKIQPSEKLNEYINERRAAGIGEDGFINAENAPKQVAPETVHPGKMFKKTEGNEAAEYMWGQ